jgi:2-iminobutanoate/2-iminopropanoate deaminase
MKKMTLTPKNLAPPVALYSHGVKVGNLIFTAGTGAFDPKTNAIVEGGIKAQTRQVLENLKAILEAGGASLEDVVQATIYITSFDDFEIMNEVYKEYFPSGFPPRATVQVAGLYDGMVVEIMAIAVVPD